MLKGQTAIVTGGSRGIGAAVCEALVQNGADVALLYAGNKERAQQTVEKLLTYGVRARAYRCDVADYEQAAHTVQQIRETFGRVDILINNAGITRDKLVMSMKPADFDEVLQTNLTGAFHMIKQVYPIFARQKSGKIVNISSVSGLMGNAGQANYAASKAGLVGLTKSVAKELASRGICCNAVAPGFIQTDMTEKFVDNEALLQQIPQKRMGRPEEVAALVLFLVSPRADYITGEVIRIDGGLAM